MVQMKLTASVLLAAAAIAPVLANVLEAENSLLTREDNEFESSFARDLDLDFEEREFEDDLLEREPGRGKFLKKASKFGLKTGSALTSITPPETPSETREFNDDVFEREFDEELYERGRGGRGKGLSMKASGGRKGMKSYGGKKGRMMKAGGGKGRMMKTGRGRGTMKALRKGNKALGKISQSVPSAPAESQPPAPQAETEAREFNDDILEREFDEELSEREVDEELMEREIDDDELFSRDVDFELFEREPEPFFDRIKKWWKNLTKGKKKNAPPAEDAAAETRSVEDMEVLERESYDELD